MDADEKESMEDIQAALNDLFNEYKSERRSVAGCSIESEMPKVKQWWDEMNKTAHPEEEQ